MTEEEGGIRTVLLQFKFKTIPFLGERLAGAAQFPRPTHMDAKGSLQSSNSSGSNSITALHIHTSPISIQAWDHFLFVKTLSFGVK